MIAFYAALIDMPAADIKGRFESLHPRLHVDKKAVHEVLDKWNLDPDRPVIAFAPGAEFGSAKRWPESHFSTLAEMISQRYPGAQIVLLGSAKDNAVCEAIHSSMPQILNLAGKTSLKEAIALIAGIHLLVTNDSGLMHVASAFDIPVIALYGSTDYRHTPPFSSESHIISLNLACAPCQKRECPLGHHDCMNRLMPALVFEELMEIMENMKMARPEKYPE